MKSKWEYMMLPLAFDRDDQNVQDALNDLGGQGWALTAVYKSEEGRIFVFKQPVE